MTNGLIQAGIHVLAGIDNKALCESTYLQNLNPGGPPPNFICKDTRMRGDDIGPTITTRCVSVSNGRFAHYDMDQNRGITPKEAALLQTFPDEFTFYPEDGGEFAAVLIGNAVPPKLAKFFGNYLNCTVLLNSHAPCERFSATRAL